jgi:hypothetical protein
VDHISPVTGLKIDPVEDPNLCGLEKLAPHKWKIFYNKIKYLGIT